VRVLLFTGKGGVGKTTAAAATAVRAAALGHKTLVVSTDAAHSLGDAFGTPLGPEPAELDAGLYAQQIDTQRAFERSWADIQRYLLAVLDAGGVEPLEAAELTVLPGADEVLALLEVRDQATSGRFDAVVVDCAPTAETLRLLALPEALRWYMDRVWPLERRIASALRPVLSRVAGVPMPGDAVFSAVERLQAELGGVHRLLTEPETTSVRLVLTPEAVVVAEARRTLTSLALYGYRVDGIVANRVISADDGPEADRWRAGWARAHAAMLAEVDQSFAPLPVRRVPYHPGEPIGVAALAALAGDLYGDDDPLACGPCAAGSTVERFGDRYVLTLALPFADRGDLTLGRRGDELIVTVGAHRRLVALPSALRRCTVDGARFTTGALRIEFLPDPDQWMAP
jgi:arsenite-transporting ATPase